MDGPRILAHPQNADINTFCKARFNINSDYEIIYEKYGSEEGYLVWIAMLCVCVSQEKVPASYVTLGII